MHSASMSEKGVLKHKNLAAAMPKCGQNPKNYKKATAS